MCAFRPIGVAVTFLALIGCYPAVQTTRRGPIDKSALETTLRRGVSTAADVEAIFGKPDGAGSLLLPAQGEPGAVLYYETFGAALRTWPDSLGDATMDLRQDVLMVFLRDDRYAGFLWFSDAVKPK